MGQLADNDEADSNEVVTSFCMHPNGNEVVVSTQNFLLRHWNLSEKKCIRVIRGHTMPVLTMSYDSTGNSTRSPTLSLSQLLSTLQLLNELMDDNIIQILP